MADPVFADGVTPLNAANMNKLQTRDEKAQAGGYASLGSDGLVPAGQLPAVVPPAPPSTLVTISTKLASYVLALVDGNTLVEMNVAAANTVTVPSNASVAFPVGTTVTVGQLGAGQTSFLAGAGVTLHAYNGNLKFAGQYGMASLVKRATDEWWLAGNLVP